MVLSGVLIALSIIDELELDKRRPLPLKDAVLLEGLFSPEGAGVTPLTHLLRWFLRVSATFLAEFSMAAVLRDICLARGTTGLGEVNTAAEGV